MPLLTADVVGKVLSKGSSARREVDRPPGFEVGEMVRVRNINPTDHTRVPRYTRGRSGTIDRVHGAFVFPDSNAAGEGENPQYCYSVRFTARELWGPGAAPGDAVYVDLWDAYLERP